MSKTLSLEVMSIRLAICQLPADSPCPDWALTGSMTSITRTPDELSVVCEQALVPEGVRREQEWACLKVRGPLDFELTGVLATLTHALAQAQVPVFAISTFDTDYLLVKGNTLDQAVEALLQRGHTVSEGAE